jgi:hypothetical protein
VQGVSHTLHVPDTLVFDFAAPLLTDFRLQHNVYVVIQQEQEQQKNKAAQNIYDNNCC